MRKKTFKIFVNSFAVSLFTIWAVNGLFAVSDKQKSTEVSIPEKNIALFFQHEAPTVNYSASTPVKTLSLAAPAPRTGGRDILIDKGLFVFDDMEDGIRINSIEDAADIPLEYSAAAQVNNTQPLKTANLNDSPMSAEETYSETDIFSTSSDKIYASAMLSESENNALSNNTELSAGTAAEDISNTNAEPPAVLASAENENAIPLEFGASANEEKIEIANKAPENQIAMADGGKVDLEKIAVEQKAEKEDVVSREWYQMSETSSSANDNPWVVAKGTRNPKNNHVLDENFYKGMSESEIAAALTAPEKIAEADKEVQVAEMVKNILIPIPEDIMNDKNLTPQLVSPKKNKKQPEDIATNSDDTLAQEEPKSGGILKSIASIFTGNEDEADTVSEDEGDTETVEKPKKRKGLFSAFSRDKAPAKILPAEMRLSFQPGRAEISGTTLRWIQAFANKVLEDPNVIIEIRIDRTSSFELQQKRLNLLHNILTNKGVEYEKINTVFTSREPNSFIIRTLRINENVNNTVQETNKGRDLYYQSW